MKNDMSAYDFSDKPLDPSFSGGFDPLFKVAVYRNPKDEFDTFTNVPHLVVNHSPTGFEWGYGGSGPSDLALNIAELYVHDMGLVTEYMTLYNGHRVSREAYRVHQAVKSEIVARMKRSGDVCFGSAVRNLIERTLKHEAA